MKSISTLLLALALVATQASAAPTAFTIEVTGQGRPMVLLPGLACPGEVWDATVARFQNRYTCHVISVAGFGGTPAHAMDGASLESIREQLAAYIRSERLERPVIVGHSLGGFVALDLAATHPELPGELILVDSLPFFMGVIRPGASVDDAKQAAQATAQAFAQMSPEGYAQMIRQGPNGSTMAAKDSDLERIIAWGLASDPATVAQAMTEMYSRDLRPQLDRVGSRALVFAAWVGYAPYSSHEYIETIYREQYASLAGFQLAITDTARHFIMFDEPEWMFAQIEAFLAADAR